MARPSSQWAFARRRRHGVAMVRGEMSRATGIAGYRLVFGLLAIAAVATQFTDLLSRSLLDPLHFFSYFTIESNLLAAVVFLTLALRRGVDRTLTIELVRGAAVVYMTVT